MKILTNKTWESIQHELERAQEERDDYKKLYEKSKKNGSCIMFREPLLPLL